MAATKTMTTDKQAPTADTAAPGMRIVGELGATYQADESAQDAPAWLRSLRAQAWESFAHHGLPVHGVEAWKRSPVKVLAERHWAVTEARPPVSPAMQDAAVAAAQNAIGAQTPTSATVFTHNGWTDADAFARAELPNGAHVLTLADALADPTVAGQLADHLAQVAPTAAPEDALCALNTAFLRDAVVLHLEPRTVIDDPIHVCHVTHDHEADAAPISFPRTIVVLGEQAEATLIQSYVPANDTAPRAGLVTDATPIDHLVVGTTEIVAQAGARLRHVKIQDESTHTAHIGPTHIRIGRDATVHDLVVSTGGRWVRNEAHAHIDAEGGEAHLDGVYLTSGTQHVDNHTVIVHAAPHGTSTEAYKGVLDGASHAAFLGSVVVAEGARKTNAEQENRNLILSTKALADSTPQLEIHNDDVKCSHGSTVGRLDENAVFFLRSRGIKEATARQMLTEAFLREVIERVPHPEFAAHLGDRIRRWIGHDRHP